MQSRVYSTAGRLSVCLSHHSHVAAAGLLLCVRRAADIDRLLYVRRSATDVMGDKLLNEYVTCAVYISLSCCSWNNRTALKTRLWACGVTGNKGAPGQISKSSPPPPLFLPSLTTPLSGRFFIGRVGLPVVNQCTKFEVSMLRIKNRKNH